jgi:hypothetical protein
MDFAQLLRENLEHLDDESRIFHHHLLEFGLFENDNVCFSDHLRRFFARIAAERRLHAEKLANLHVFTYFVARIDGGADQDDATAL